MASILNDANHWPERAQEARAIAAETDNELVRRTMLGIAAEYEYLAKRADDRGKSRESPVSGGTP